jgi:GMP synthase (glutamine-hydrolysing)
LTSNVLVVDFGAQYAQLIARRVREAHVYSEIVPSTISAEDVRAKSPSAIILSGGPKSVYEVPAPSLDPAIYDLGIPVLGICYGAQLMAQQLGGEVAHTGAGEYGRTELTRQGPSVLMSKWPVAGTCWMSHGDAIATPPDGFVVSASSPGAKVAVMEDVTRHLYAVQFHPEVVHTEHGQELISDFLHHPTGRTRRSSTIRSRRFEPKLVQSGCSARYRAASIRRSRRHS